MSQPIWITPGGNLGTIPEGIFYRIPLEAVTPQKSITARSATGNGFTTTLTFIRQVTPPFAINNTVALAGFVPIELNGTFLVTAVTNSSVTIEASFVGTATTLGTITTYSDTVFYSLVAGELPAGLQINENGILSGIPKAQAKLQGVPEQVSRDVTSKFAVRAYTRSSQNGVLVINRLTDRTFNLTVTGEDAPEFITPPGQIAQYFDGSVVYGLQIEFTDVDPGDVVISRLVAGSLPPGLSLDTRGLISGFIAPLTPVEGTAGFSRDRQGFSEYPFDFNNQSVNQNYEFTVEITDGKSNNIRTFSIYVWSRNSLSADDTFITADNTFVTADGSPNRVPILLNTPGSIGTVRNDNFFAYQFIGLDLDGGEIGFQLFTSAPGPLPGLSLDPTSGWLYGYIPNTGITEVTYNFTVRVYKATDPLVISDPQDYSLTITGPRSSDIVWLTDSDLGSIDNGAISHLYVRAQSVADVALQYQLLSGSDSSLPQGLQLLPTGEIAGRVSFNTFALDLGTTTFDINYRDQPTTFDMVYTFTVNCFSVGGLVNINKQFSITVVRAYNEPYENLYIQAMPPQNDRDMVSTLLQNQDIFPNDLIYRPNDFNFGIATKVIYYHAFGLTSSTVADYLDAMDINHYWKNLVLGPIRVAQALDANTGEIIYDVVYSAVIDNLVNDQGQSVSKEVTLPYTTQVDGQTVSTVYPNSLINMRDQVIDQIGQISNILPLWMTSKQTDGQVLGFTPAWILCYAQPGKGDQIAYNIATQFGENLNLVDFRVDRYELDALLSKNWNPTADNWVPSPAQITTFDLTTDISAVVDWVNDLDESVTWINYNPEDFVVVWINGAQPGSQGTYFDGGAMKFTDPVDMYTNTTAFDKYLLFPRRNILK